MDLNDTFQRQFTIVLRVIKFILFYINIFKNKFQMEQNFFDEDSDQNSQNVVIVSHQQDTKVCNRICKICLDQGGYMISPCMCSGSMKYIHYACLQQWLLNILKQKSAAQLMKTCCEVCGTKYNFRTKKLRYLSMRIFCKNFSRYRSSFYYFGLTVIILLIFSIIMLIGLILINNNSSTGKILTKTLSLGENTNMLFSSLIFISITVLIMIILIFVIQYGIEVQLKIEKIFNYKKDQIKEIPKINARIHPR